MKLPGREEESAVVVGVVMDNVWTLEVLKSKEIPKSGEQPDQSIILKPEGKSLTSKSRGTILLSGLQKGRGLYWHFVKTPRTSHSHTKPYVHSKGRSLSVPV